MAPRSILITGANRGIGLEFVKQYVSCDSPPEFLFATCRKLEQASELQAIAEQHLNVKIIQLEVTNYDQFNSIVKEVEDVVGEKNGLNLLINNAGILIYESGMQGLTVDSMMKSFEVNCVSPIILTRSFLPLLQRAAHQNVDESKNGGKAAVVQIGAHLGSIEAITSGLFSGVNLPIWYAYNCSKTALNMGTMCLATELKDSGILFKIIHPGWVQTDMGGPNASLTTEQSVKMMIEHIGNIGNAEQGEFFSFDGTKIPW